MAGTDLLADAGLRRRELGDGGIWVVKIGSALIAGETGGIQTERLAGWCRQIAALMAAGKRVAVVSSGAVAEGCRRLGFDRRPATVHDLQAAAAVGQIGLAEAYERAFRAVGRTTAMVLLTHDDLSSRERYLNARATLNTLLSLGAAPVINENDSVATDEIKLGDNDALAGRVASLLGAHALVILTDRDGLHESDPARSPDAPLVRSAAADDPRLDAMAGDPGRLGRGGMATKLKAARFAALSGAGTLIANGAEPEVLPRLAAGEPLGTVLAAGVAPLDARKRWLAGHLRARGDLRLDAGAVRALRAGGSVLPVGVVGTAGKFRRGDMVRVVGPDGVEVGKGLVNYDAAETRKLLGRNSGEIESLLGYVDEPELVHRDNLVVLAGAGRDAP